MKMKVGIIGLKRRIEAIKDVEIEYNTLVDFTYITLNEIPKAENLVMLIKNCEKQLDGIIFTGHVLYDILIKLMIPSIPWDYLHRDDNQLYRALLEASLVYHKNPFSISLDSYTPSTVKQVYNSFGITDNNLQKIQIAKDKTIDQDLIKYLQNFHKMHYQKGNVSCCITGLASIYEYLKQNKIPCFCLDPSQDTIKETINRLLLKNEATINQNSQIVVLATEIDIINDNSVFQENEYEIIIDRITISKEIYHFAQKIDGAVVENGLRGYYIFTTRNIIERETKNLKELNLLENVATCGVSTISVGIGYGATIREAKSNALRGMKKANKNGGNQAFVVYDRKKYLGPIKSTHRKANQDEDTIDESLYQIAEASDLSINTIFKLYCIMIQNKKETFTSRELANYYGITARSMNRIIKNLEKSGYAKIVGRRVISNAGRPSRLIKFNFTL